MVTAGISIVSALGLLAFLRVPFNSIVCVMPFMIFSIGVDDMFVMSGSWARTDPSQPAQLRMAHMMAHSAVAITITSLTDALSFAIGCFAVIPAVWLFCLYSALAISFNYFYQITFFAALMAIFGELEEANRHSVFFIKLRPDHTKGPASSAHSPSHIIILASRQLYSSTSPRRLHQSSRQDIQGENQGLDRSSQDSLVQPGLQCTQTVHSSHFQLLLVILGAGG